MHTLVEVIEQLGQAPAGYGFSFVPERGEGVSHLPHNELLLRTEAHAGLLQSMGLCKGDRIALILPDAEDFLIWFLAAVRVGIIPVPMYPPMMLGNLDSYVSNARHILTASGSRFVLTSKKLKLLLGRLQSGVGTLESIIAVEKLQEAPPPMRAELVSPSDVAFLQFTSGSTAKPKGVALTHSALLANIKGISDRFQLRLGRDMGVSWLPLYHDMGLIGCALTPLYHGGPATLIPPIRFLREPALWLRTIAKNRATISIAPNFAYGLCARRVKPSDIEGDLSSWRVAGCGAEPIDPRVLESFADVFAGSGFRRNALLPVYGMAEHALAITIPPSPDTEMECASVDPHRLRDDLLAANPAEGAAGVRLVVCGTALDGHRVAVFARADAESAEPLGDLQVGEIRVTGPSLMKGYWNDPESTRKAFAGDYFRTGDLGFLQDGKLVVCGRIKELLIINGRNYFPQDIEAAVMTVPGVRKGCVIAFGTSGVWQGTSEVEKVIVALEAKDPDTVDQRQVVQTVLQLVGVSLDEVLVLSPGQLPKTSSGKLQRVQTRQLYESQSLRSNRSHRDDAGNGKVLKQLILSQAGYLKSVLQRARPD